MRKTLLLIFILIESVLAFGQTNKYGFSLQINNVSNEFYNDMFNSYMRGAHKSFSTGFMFCYNLSNESTLRLRFGYTKFNYKNENENLQSQYQSNENQTREATTLSFAPGIIWKITRNKLDLYAGFELPVNISKDIKYEQNYRYQTEQALTYSNETESFPKQNSYGIAAILGFNYFLQKWIAIGAEFSPALLYLKQSGEYINIYQSNDPGEPYQKTTKSQIDRKGYTLYDQRFSINISFWL
jgi:hypothetical protein